MLRKVKAWMSYQMLPCECHFTWDGVKDGIVENFAAEYHQAAPPPFEEAGWPSAFNQLEC